MQTGIGLGHSHWHVLELNLCGGLQIEGRGHMHWHVVSLKICAEVQVGLGVGHSH